MKRVLKFLDEKLELTIAVILMFLLVILAAWSVLSRFIFNRSLAWSEELIRYVFIFMNYMAASAAVIHDQHARVEIVDLVLPPHCTQMAERDFKNCLGCVQSYRRNQLHHIGPKNLYAPPELSHAWDRNGLYLPGAAGVLFPHDVSDPPECLPADPQACRDSGSEAVEEAMCLCRHSAW